MHIPIIQDIVVTLGVSVLVLLIFQKIKLPAIAGFLVTGAIAGPYGLSLINAPDDVAVLAEIGVILLLFLIGMEFSLKNLFAVKKAVFIGGSAQVVFTISVFACIAYIFGLQLNQSIFIGFLFSLSSTAIVLKLLQDKGEVNSPHGKTALAILIFQDIIVVPMMLLTPMLSGKSANIVYDILILGVKGLALVGLVIICARYIVPKLLFQVARTKSKELFLLTIVVICFSVAWLSSELGLSLALGAFLAGLIISESEYSHEATANILPFRELFTSFFFVSIGMLLEAKFLLNNFPVIILLTLLTFLIKGAISSSAPFILKFPLRTSVLVGLCLFQVGEFSFILSRTGLEFELLTQETYQYFLSVSILTMLLTPFVIKYSNKIYYNVFGKLFSIEKTEALRELSHERHSEDYNDHLVIIGYGINGQNVAKAARQANIKYVIIELNAETVMRERQNGETIIYGDAVKTNILYTVNIQKARVAVIAISDPDATKRILSNILNISTKVHTIIRTRFVHDMDEYFRLGADEVIPEEFETSIEIFTRVLHNYLVPQNEIQGFIRNIRATNYEMLRPMAETKIQTMGIDIPDMDIATLSVQQGRNDIVGKRLMESAIRKKFGITIVGIKRGNAYLNEIYGDTEILQDDILYVFGNPEKIFQFNEKIKL